MMLQFTSLTTCNCIVTVRWRRLRQIVVLMIRQSSKDRKKKLKNFWIHNWLKAMRGMFVLSAVFRNVDRIVVLCPQWPLLQLTSNQLLSASEVLKPDTCRSCLKQTYITKPSTLLAKMLALNDVGTETIRFPSAVRI